MMFGNSCLCIRDEVTECESSESLNAEPSSDAEVMCKIQQELEMVVGIASGEGVAVDERSGGGGWQRRRLYKVGLLFVVCVMVMPCRVCEREMREKGGVYVFQECRSVEMRRVEGGVKRGIVADAAV